MIQQAEAGNLVAADIILNRIEGKVAETHQIQGAAPITLLFRPAFQVTSSEPELALPPPNQTVDSPEVIEKTVLDGTNLYEFKDKISKE